MPKQKTSKQKTLQLIKNIKRIVILGHSGFIGSNLEHYFQEKYPNIELVGRALPSIDFTKEEELIALKDFFDTNTAVVMLAAIKPNIGNDLETFVRNVQMVVNLCKLLQKNPVARLVYFSSAAVYGEDVHNIHITEETPINSRSYYGISKYACERLLWKTFNEQNNEQKNQQKNEQKNSSLLILRPPVIYGPGEKEVIYNPAGFVKKALNHEKITLWGDGSEKREFIFIDDIIRIVDYFIFHDYSGILNVASGKSYTFNEIIDTLSKLGIKAQLDSRERTKEKADNEFDNKLLVKLMPGFKFISLNEGIKKVLEYESKISKTK
jgi:UDP-glucose 4-epimerase